MSKKKKSKEKIPAVDNQSTLLSPGPSHGLRLPDVQTPGPEAEQAAGAANHQGRGGDRAGVPHRCSAREASGHELRAHVRLHRVCRRPPASRPHWGEGKLMALFEELLQSKSY